MTTLAQAEVIDTQRARHAKAKAKRVLPPEIATAVVDKLDDIVAIPAFIDRGRLRRLCDEVAALEEIP